MSNETIHNPKEPRHFMRAKIVPRTVRVHRGGKVIAESDNVLRVTELAKDMLDPVLYFPKEDISVPLLPIEGKTSHCPLKGDASYFTVDDNGEAIAWAYEAAFDFAEVINGRIAFYPDHVVVEEVGTSS
ncbi:DUF427 domain-containing protein [Microbulbifer sp. OS29]|uniref:DUF427 domain-containing protein n=1 Tax=Microbulbifer okhotskensis TaxID=2926617 RepID=A0A9X2EQU1_9GAMM|nr:DUF427 domain-containing protein [Microbulbifer okhotskensis]MCO1336129.1 DUF427 domain-containing protein [Microbulbifer okhotskensis]